MKTYCYAMRNATTGAKMVGGMLHAETIEDASKLVPKYCKVERKVTGTKAFPRYRWMKDGKEVFLSITVTADYNLDDKAKAEYDALPDGY